MLTFLTFLLPLYDCPAVVLGLHIHAHPHTNETSEGNCALGQVIGDLEGSVKKTKSSLPPAIHSSVFLPFFYVINSIFKVSIRAILDFFLGSLSHLFTTGSNSVVQLRPILSHTAIYEPKSSKVKKELYFKFVSVTLVIGPSFSFYELLCICYVESASMHTMFVLEYIFIYF